MFDTGLLLDTHVWIWALSGTQLNLKIQALLEKQAHAGCLFLSCISLWEVSMLVAKNKIHLDRPCQEWIEVALSQPNIHVVQIDPAIAVESAHLPGSFHGDPADRIIVATARVKTFSLLTKDEKILAYAEQHYLNAIAVI